MSAFDAGAHYFALIRQVILPTNDGHLVKRLNFVTEAPSVRIVGTTFQS